MKRLRFQDVQLTYSPAPGFHVNNIFRVTATTKTGLRRAIVQGIAYHLQLAVQAQPTPAN
jgi:hypothetical protein